MITNSVPLSGELNQTSIKSILSEYRINNAHVTVHEPDSEIDQFIDVLEGNRVYVPMIKVSKMKGKENNVRSSIK
jgi:ribosome-interacting GTPase 1